MTSCCKAFIYILSPRFGWIAPQRCIYTCFSHSLDMWGLINQILTIKTPKKWKQQ